MSFSNSLESCSSSWLLRKAAEQNVDEKTIIEAKVKCVLSVMFLVDDHRSYEALNVAVAYTKGSKTLEQLIKAADIAYEAYCNAYKAYAKNSKISSKENYLIEATYYATYAVYDSVRPKGYKANRPQKRREIRVVLNIQNALGAYFKYKNPDKWRNRKEYFEVRENALKETRKVCYGVLKTPLLDRGANN